MQRHPPPTQRWQKDEELFDSYAIYMKKSKRELVSKVVCSRSYHHRYITCTKDHKYICLKASAV